MGWSGTRPRPSRRADRARRVEQAAALVVAALGIGTVSVRSEAAEPGPAPASTPASTDVSPTAPAPDSAAVSATVFRPAEWETLSTGLPEQARLGPVIWFRYNRVDGPAPTLGAAVRSERAPEPLLHAQGTYAFSRERFLYDVGFDIPWGDRVRLRTGGAAYRQTATEDAWIVGELENTIFALVARTDYRDYYEAEGLRASASWEPGLDFALRVTGRIEDQRSLRNEANASLFGDDDRFRPNPTIEDGEERAIVGAIRIGPSALPRDGGTRGDLAYERSGGPLEGDFDYGRARAEVRGSVRLSPRQDARARLIGGSTLEGDLPPQKVWHLGGIGTLRGQDFKEDSGDQFLLANAEYYVLARKNVWAFAFLDWGGAWFGRDNLPRQTFYLDGGLGVRIAEGPLAVTVARNLQESNAAIRVAVRLGGSF